MKKVKQINNWVIKEKTVSEIPLGIEEDRKYAIFSPNGTFMEDNLLLKEAVEFCETNLDYVKRKGFDDNQNEE